MQPMLRQTINKTNSTILIFSALVEEQVVSEQHAGQLLIMVIDAQLHSCNIRTWSNHCHSPLSPPITVLLAATKVITAGVRVAVCEVPFHYIASEHQGGLGGTCVLRGCVPKKLLSYGGEFINDFKAAEGYGCVACSTSRFVLASRL